MARILLADDDAGMRTALAAGLTADGHQVTLADNGADALAMLTAAGSSVEILISDVQMPELDGFALAEKALALPSPPAIILMSGHADGFARGAALASRVSAMLTKPISRDALRAAVAKAKA